MQENASSKDIFMSHAIPRLIRDCLAKNKRLPTHSELSAISETMGHSSLITDYCGWATWTHEAMVLIQQECQKHGFTKLLEVGAGTGFASHILTTYYGLSSIATDLPDYTDWYRNPNTWTLAKRVAAQTAAATYSKIPILMAYPPTSLPDPDTGEADPTYADMLLRSLRSGRIVIYNGDKDMLRNGGPPMQEILQQDFEILAEVPLPIWLVSPAKYKISLARQWPIVRKQLLQDAVFSEPEVLRVYQKK